MAGGHRGTPRRVTAHVAVALPALPSTAHPPRGGCTGHASARLSPCKLRATLCKLTAAAHCPSASWHRCLCVWQAIAVTGDKHEAAIDRETRQLRNTLATKGHETRVHVRGAWEWKSKTQLPDADPKAWAQ